MSLPVRVLFGFHEQGQSVMGDQMETRIEHIRLSLLLTSGWTTEPAMKLPVTHLMSDMNCTPEVGLGLSGYLLRL